MPGARLRPQSSAWLAPAALAAQLRAQAGETAGRGWSALGSGIASGFAERTRRSERAEETALRQSEIARSERHYQDALSRQDTMDSVSLLKEKMETLELLRQGTMAEIGIAADSGGEPDPAAFERLKTILSGQRSIQSQRLSILSRRGGGAVSVDSPAADPAATEPGPSPVAPPYPADRFAPGTRLDSGGVVRPVPAPIPDDYEGVMARRLQVEAEIDRKKAALDRYKDVRSPSMARKVAELRSDVARLESGELPRLKAREVVVGAKDEVKKARAKADIEIEAREASERRMKAEERERALKEKSRTVEALGLSPTVAGVPGEMGTRPIETVEEGDEILEERKFLRTREAMETAAEKARGFRAEESEKGREFRRVENDKRLAQQRDLHEKNAVLKSQEAKFRAEGRTLDYLKARVPVLNGIVKAYEFDDSPAGALAKQEAAEEFSEINKELISLLDDIAEGAAEPGPDGAAAPPSAKRVSDFTKEVLRRARGGK